MITLDQLYENIANSPLKVLNQSLTALWGTHTSLNVVFNILRARNERLCLNFLEFVSLYIQALKEYDKLHRDCLMNIYNYRMGFVRIRTDKGVTTDGIIMWPQPPAVVTIHIGRKACLYESFKPFLVNGKVEFLQHGRDGSIDLVEEGKCRAHFSDPFVYVMMETISCISKDVAFLIADMVSGRYDLEWYMTELGNNLHRQRALQADAKQLLRNQSSTSSQ